jgi:predicted RNA-binding Zn-ribbon protein involved in translation (DUF1610 family)
MSDPKTNRAKDSCPHCGNRLRLSLSQLLPSRDNNRVMTCPSCGGHFDLANTTKMAAVATGMVSMVFAMFGPFQWIVKAGGGTRSAMISGIVVAVLVVGLAATTASRLALHLERKP